MADETTQGGSFTSPAQIGDRPQDVVKRWVLELDLAEKGQREWAKKALEIIEKYRGTKAKKNSFNILWSNTETLRQAVYNTLPKPDVRRRYRDTDVVGKVVSDVIERCATYAMDAYDFDYVLKLDLLDMLLPGRGISRVKYVPDLEDMECDTSQAEPDGEEDAGAAAPVAVAEPQQRIKYEMVMCDHVQWDDFRHGPGKTWDEVRWIAFRHRFSKRAGIEKFGDIFDRVTLSEVSEVSVKKAGEEISGLFKTAEAWEIWDKDTETVLFIAPAFKESPLQEEADPLELDGFYPIPRPLYAIEDASSLLPTTLYAQYEQQAEELNRVTARINILTDALKLRGVYNKVLKEIGNLQNAADNELQEVTNIEYLIESGGIEKNIWYMPITQAADVIKVLMVQRDAIKAVIYEITGIADIMRGATDPNETKGAQVIKTVWGTQRLKKMQTEFQRYVRDIMRLKCQIIANKFQPETIKAMTGIKLANSEAEKQAIRAQAAAFEQFQKQQQMAQQQAAQQQAGQGQPPGPPQGMPQQMQGAPA